MKIVRAAGAARAVATLAAGAAAALLGAGQARAQLTAAEQTVLLAQHNADRSQVALGQVAGQPAAANMQQLVWDPAVAQTAQSWANGCNFSHNPNRGNTGENLALLSGVPLSPAALQQAVGLWFAENSGYTYGPVSASDLSHGHYTQVVWATSGSLGCGATFCPTVVNGPSNSTFVVCNYAPPGNFIGQTPYTQGPSCSQCPAGLGGCNNGLCAVPPPPVPAVPTVALPVLALLLGATALARFRRAGASAPGGHR
jgi:hypothetical protein